MKENTKFLFVLAFIVLLLFLVFVPLGPLKPKDFVKNRTYVYHSDLLFNYEITRYPSAAEIIPLPTDEENAKIGFVVDPWNLNFGIIPANGSQSTRNIELTNLNDDPSRISFNVFGNILGLVSFSNNDFVLNRGEKVTIEVYFSSEKAETGNYSGEIDVIARKPKYGFIPV